MMIGKRIGIGALMLGLAMAAHADLVFEQSRVAISPGLLDKKTEAAFVFTNEGDQPITITGVKSSCGCTTAVAKDSVIQPGASSAVDVDFTFGDRFGKQVKRIVLSTDHPKQPRITLSMVVEVPRLVAAKPAVLMWRANDTEREAKQTRLDLIQDERVKLIGLGKLPKGITADLQQPDPKKKPLTWVLSVDPGSAGELAGGPYAVPVKLKVEGKEVEHLVRVRVMAPKKHEHPEKTASKDK